MESIYYAVKVLALLWILIVIFLALLGGTRNTKDDRGSQLLVAVTISSVLSIIRYTTDNGVNAPGAFVWGFPWVSYVGFLIIGFGILIHYSGISTLGKQWSVTVVIKENHQLVETGIYKYIRHPIYAAILLELLGMGVALSNWITVLALVIPNAASLAYRIHVEEKTLEKYFGPGYLEYARRTSRLIPRIF